MKNIFNKNRSHFFGLKSLGQCFAALTKGFESSQYKIEIFVDGNDYFLTSQKKLLNILSKGGEIEPDISLI